MFVIPVQGRWGSNDFHSLGSSASLRFFQLLYEACKRKRGMTLIALQPNVPDDAYMSHMKGMYVPFNMAYGSLIYH